VPTTEALHLPQQHIRPTVKVALETPAGMRGDDCSRVGEEWVTDGQGLGVRHVEGSAPQTTRRIESSNDLAPSEEFFEGRRIGGGIVLAWDRSWAMSNGQPGLKDESLTVVITGTRNRILPC
jgi:hypothetical protein